MADVVTIAREYGGGEASVIARIGNAITKND